MGKVRYGKAKSQKKKDEVKRNLVKNKYHILEMETDRDICLKQVDTKERGRGDTQFRNRKGKRVDRQVDSGHQYEAGSEREEKGVQHWTVDRVKKETREVNF